MIPIIDTHQHLWELDRFSLPWLDGFTALKRDHTMSDYRAQTAGCGVAATLYMEVDVAPGQQADEARYAAELCRRPDNPLAGAVIAGNPAGTGFRDHVARFSDDSAIKGVRQVLWPPQLAAGTCLQPAFVDGLRHLGELGWSFDLCMRPSELGDAVGRAELCPDTRSFGVERVVFGGNWPVCTLVSGVGDWIMAFRGIIADRPQHEQRAILHDNAVRVYGLG